MNLLFAASFLAELRRNSIGLIEIDKITIEPFFNSCQPENLWGCEAVVGYFDLSIRTVINQRFSISRQNRAE